MSLVIVSLTFRGGNSSRRHGAQLFLGGWEVDGELSASRSTAVLHASATLHFNEGYSFKELQIREVSFDFAYTFVADEVLEFCFASIWIGVLPARILIFLKDVTPAIN